MERVLELLKAQATAVPATPVDAYAIIPDLAAMPAAMVCCQALRGAGVKVQMHTSNAEGMGSMKSQFKKADASGAKFALIFGADELARGEVTLKALRDGTGAQSAQVLSQAGQWAALLLA